LNCWKLLEWDPSKISRIELFRGIEVALEFILFEPETQINGVVGILNFGDLTLSHILEANPSFASMAVKWVFLKFNILAKILGFIYFRFKRRFL
jgi:hypothetical protein